VVQRSRAAYLCFQCRYSWTVDGEAAPRVCFRAAERRRLIAYRDAARAGFYSDWELKA
jgi:hypothetical protein